MIPVMRMGMLAVGMHFYENAAEIEQLDHTGVAAALEGAGQATFRGIACGMVGTHTARLASPSKHR
jgi:hypothetical protein